jgi:hypothetical protein
MRYTWEEGDIQAGRRVLSWNKADEFVIGYDPRIEGKDNWVLVALADGMIIWRECSAMEMARNLNDDNERSKYIVNPSPPRTYPYLPKDIR